MKTIFQLIAPLIALTLLLPNFAAAALLNCEYNFYGAPAGTVRIDISPEGAPGKTAYVALFSTPTTDAPVTALAPNNGELINIIIFKDDPNNELYMTVNLPSADGAMKSKMINPKLSGPAGTIPGVCKF